MKGISIPLQPLVKVKSHLYYEDRDKVNEALRGLKTVPGSKIIYFKNGESQGEAFIDIHHGAYYPAISIYKNATVSINFGPNFKYPNIEEEFKCKGVCIEIIFIHNNIVSAEYILTDFGIFFFSLRTDARSCRRADIGTAASRYDVLHRKRWQIEIG